MLLTRRRPDPAHDRLAALTGPSGWLPADPDDPTSGTDDAPAVRSSRGRHLAAVPDVEDVPRASPLLPPTLLPPTLLPSTLSGGRWSVRGRAAVGALVALAVLGGAVAVRAGAPAEGATPAPARAGVSSTAAATSDPTGSPSAGPADESPAGAAPSADAAVGGEVVVHVVGQVAHAGLVRVPAGARVADAIEAAGGATGTADLTLVNLARAVVDGEQLVVPRPGEAVAALPGTAAGPPTGTVAAGDVAGPLDLNTADLAALDALDGIGPVLAQRILDWRTENGRFSSVEELGEVSGIGDKLLAQLRDAVRV